MLWTNNCSRMRQRSAIGSSRARGAIFGWRMPGDDRARRVAEWVRGRANARHAFDRVSLRRRARRTSGRYPEAAVGAAPSPPRSAWARCFADASRAPRPSARRLPCPSGTSRTPGARRAWTPSCSTGENARVYARIRGTAARAMTCPRPDSSSKTGLGELEVNAKLKRDRSKSGVKSVVPVSKCSENINQKPSSRDQNNELFEAN